MGERNEPLTDETWPRYARDWANEDIRDYVDDLRARLRESDARTAGWEETARTYAANSDHHREKREQAEAALALLREELAPAIDYDYDTVMSVELKRRISAALDTPTTGGSE